MDALAFLDKAAKAKPQPVYVLAGDEPFLKRQALAALDAVLLGDADPDFARTTHPGPTADWSAVRADLDTLPFLSPRRVVVIDQADPFVTKYRAALEKYAAEPSKTGTLILDVKSWPANTKLAKLIPDAATVVCKMPDKPHLAVPLAAKWVAGRAKAEYGKTLAADAAGWLVELVGPELGVLDQEAAKLAAYVGDRSAITREDVDRLVGRSRAAETFKIFDAIGAGRPAEALAILGRLLDQGEEPLGLLGAFSWQLRRLAKAARLVRAGRSIPAAVEAVGFQAWARDRVEAQLRHLGRRRLDRVYDWLLEADLALKSSGALPERVVLERLVVRLARPRAG